MKIAVIGAGGVGGYFGGRLAQGEHDVTIVARGAHLEAIRRDGLQVTSPKGDFTVHPYATDDIEALRDLDVVLLATKLGAFPEILPRLAGTLKPQTAVVPIQNGFDAHDRIAGVLGKEHALAGTCMIMSVLNGPGKVAHLGIDNPSITFGEVDSHKSARALAFADALNAVGIDGTVPDDVLAAIWDKFMGIGPMSALSAITRVVAKGIHAVPELTETLVRQALEETLAVANAQGITFPDDMVERKLDIVRNAPAGAMASMGRDLIAGKPSELEDLIGAMVRHADSLGVPAPLMKSWYWCLKPQEMLARGEISF